VQDLLQAVAAGQVQAIVGLGADADVEGTALAPFSRVGDVVLLLSHEGPLARFATVTLPATSWVESPGSFVNARGIAQAYLRALAPKGDARPAWELAAMLGRALGHELSYRKFKDVRAALLARAPAAHPDHKPEAATPVAEDAAKAPAGA
jgi:predicted molibdopterin-dependent oxidoreductase YjgC